MAADPDIKVINASMKRIMTALIVGAGWLFILFSGSFTLFWLTLSLVIGLALFEYFSMLCATRHKDDITYGVLFCILPAVAAYYKTQDAVALALLLSLLLIFARIIFNYGSYNGNGFDTLCRYCFGAIYIGFFATHLILLMTNGGPWSLVLLTAITIATDSAAYYTGSYLGKTKLCPAISPGKTVVGLIGGLIGGTITGISIGLLFLPACSPLVIGLVSLAIAAIGMASDLIESMVKRTTRIKDSGSLLPGHGGILDRIDSLLAAAPVFYYLVHYGFITCH